MRTARPLAPLALVAALGLVLGGCTPADDDAPGRPAPVDEGARLKTHDAGPGRDAPDDAASGGGAAAASELAACIVGEWYASPEDLAATSDAMMASTGLDTTTTVTGGTTTIIDGTTVTSVYDDQVTEMTFESAGQTIVSRARMDGRLTQTYTLDGDVMTTVAGDVSGVTAESTVLIDGEAVPGYSEGFQQGFASGAASGQTGRQRVTCSGDTLQLTTLDLAGLLGADMTVTLTRR